MNKVIAYLIGGGLAFALAGMLIAKFLNLLNDLLRPPRDMILMIVLGVILTAFGLVLGRSSSKNKGD